MKYLNYVFAIILTAAFSISAQESGAIFYQSLAWSPDGKYLTVTGMRDMNQKERTMKADIYTLRTDGSDFKKNYRQREERILSVMGEKPHRVRGRCGGFERIRYLHN